MESIVEEPAVAYQQKVSLEAYFNMQADPGCRYEYWDGELVAMAGGSLSHADLTDNLNGIFKKNLSKKGCKSFQQNVWLSIKKDNLLFLPDVIVSCFKDELNPDNRMLEHPTLLAEVLSDSTELYDRTQKWEKYRKIPSLRYYLLVSKKRPFVEMYQRPNATSLFQYEVFEGLAATIYFRAFDLTVSLADIYNGIEVGN
jgi:Uma2 family endonuclease